MIAASEYVRRRRQLMEMAGPDAAVVVPAAPARIRNNDAHYPYRQDSDLLYLTGFEEPEAVLVLVPGREAAASILFCRERDLKREIWDGPRLGPEAAPEQLGLDDAFPIEDIDDILPGLLENRERIYYPFGRDADFDLKVMSWVNQTRARLRGSARSPQGLIALGHLLHELRLFKSRDELKVMTKAAAITVQAHRRLLEVCRPGMSEYEIEAELLHVFRRQQAVPAYEPIVGGGANACILHYRNNNAMLQEGTLLLVDAGAEYHNYAADVTRTIPVSGVYSKPQREIYELVLAAQLAAIDAVRPGEHWEAPHRAAVQVISEGLLRLGLLKGSIDEVIAEGRYQRFFMHKTGHWLGLDVHDVGDYRIDGQPRLLEPGMVLTVEPGIYIAPDDTSVARRWRGIGVRIEDDVVVTRQGHKVLTEAAPKTVAEIEAAMAQARQAA
ncbi:MAG: Xaa-Pro aminopeptidase [Xanthomonadales bacterium]|nr:Xaa-Pro aminopeptidase [Xanthomonadales bacterium]MCB1642780.1 Xaa-Pro aminopeptidase [Xanthomonadales bacterium]